MSIIDDLRQRVKSLEVACDQLHAEKESMKKDAERYRFLRGHGVLLKNHDFLSYGEIADFRIDAMSSGSIIPPDPVSELLKSLDRAHAGHMVGHDQSDQPRGGYSEGYVRGYGACIESARRILGIKP